MGEAEVPAEDTGRRRLPGSPDRYGSANARTHRCANEGGWCRCSGNVVYTKKCTGFFSCNQASWETVVSYGFNSNHKSNVNGGVRCDNANFGDPWPGYEKQCFCHPRGRRFSSLPLFGRRQLASIDEEAEVPAVEEPVMSAEDNADDRRQLAGLPDRYGWANSGTHRCANEGGWCSCTGNVVYTKKCTGMFSCNRASWGRVVSERWNSNHKANVNGGVRCNNGNFGGDPFPGHDKQCFCHPRQQLPSWFSYWQRFFGRRQLAAIDEEAEVPAAEEPVMSAVEEAVMSAEDNADDRRQLAGLPDRYGWANGGTHRCANEGGYCSCTGNVVYTKKCAGTFSCNRASWGRVVSERWNSNHKANVNGGVRCNNGNFGGDPFPGHDKQCFCHPVQQQPTQYDYVQKWTERR